MKHFFVLGVIAIILWSLLQPQHHKQPILPSSITTAPIIDEVVALGINLPKDVSITAQDIQAGKYPIIALEVAPNEYIIDMPRRIGHLTQFDVDHTGVLDARDPIFSRLELGFISADGTTIKFTSFKDAGIRAIL